MSLYFYNSFILSGFHAKQKFANDSLRFPLSDSCELCSPETSISPCAKLVIFRKTNKESAIYFSLAMIIHISPNDVKMSTCLK